MGYQPKHGAAGGAGDHLPRLHSPRVGVGGSMTRRANSFKRCPPGGEIELQITGSPRSPRTDALGSPPSDAAEPSSSSSSAYAVGGGHQQQHLRFRLFKRPGSGGGAGEVVLGLGIRERRKLGNLLFFAFCGVCLLLGLGKIWAGGRSALPAGDNLQDLSVSFSDKGHHHFGYMGGKERDRMLMTVESSIGEKQGSVAEASDVWSQPSSANFRQ